MVLWHPITPTLPAKSLNTRTTPPPLCFWHKAWCWIGTQKAWVPLKVLSLFGSEIWDICIYWLCHSFLWSWWSLHIKEQKARRGGNASYQGWAVCFSGTRAPWAATTRRQERRRYHHKDGYWKATLNHPLEFSCTSKQGLEIWIHHSPCFLLYSCRCVCQTSSLFLPLNFSLWLKQNKASAQHHQSFKTYILTI